MQEIGKLFRKLRTDRHLTLKQVADKQNSLSFISSFENGQSQISFNRLIYLLDKINVSVEEFLYLRGKDTFIPLSIAYSDHNSVFLTSTFMHQLGRFSNQLFNSKMHTKAEKIQGRTKLITIINSLKETDQVGWNHYIVILYQIQLAELNREIDHTSSLTTLNQTREKLCRPIVSYLYNIENWSTFEVILFGFSHPAMPIQTVHQLQSIAIKRTAQSDGFPILQTMRFNLLFSLFATYINARKLQWASDVLALIKQLIAEREDSSYAIEYHFYQGWYEFIKSNGTAGENKMNEAITILDLLNEPQTKAGFKAALHIIKQNQAMPEKWHLFIL